MKQLIPISNSLMPLWQKDFDWMQQGVRESFAAILKTLGLGRDCYIISGCEIADNGSRISMLPGWAFWNGEIFPVRAMPSTPHSSGTVKIKLTHQTGYSAEGVKSVTVNNVVSATNTYQEDFLVPSIASANDSYYLAVEEGFWDLATRLVKRSEPADSGVVSSSIDGASWRRVGGTVQIFGTLFNDALGGFHGEVASGFPRPSADLRFPCSTLAEGDYMVLTTAGKLFAYSKANRLYLDHVSYLTTPVTATNDNDGHYSTIANINPGGGGAQS